MTKSDRKNPCPCGVQALVEEKENVYRRDCICKGPEAGVCMNIPGRVRMPNWLEKNALGMGEGGRNEVGKKRVTDCHEVSNVSFF